MCRAGGSVNLPAAEAASSSDAAPIYLLRDNPNCIRIFLSSDMEDRIDHIAEIYGVSKDEAKKED